MELGTTQKVKEEKVDQLTTARRRFVAHLLTFWHLTFLTCHYLDPANKVRIGSATAAAGGRVWKERYSGLVFQNFDAKLGASLYFIKQKLLSVRTKNSIRLSSSKVFEEKCVVIVANYDACLNIVENLDYSSVDEDFNSDIVCSAMVEQCRSGIRDLFDVPVLWSSLIVYRVRQLLLLAIDYSEIHNCGDTITLNRLMMIYRKDKLDRLTKLSKEHAALIEELRQHFIDGRVDESKARTDDESGSLEYFKPIIPQHVLEKTFSDNATCAAEQIPVALTAIIHDYSHLDPFCADDMVWIQANVAALHNIVKVDKVDQPGQL